MDSYQHRKQNKRNSMLAYVPIHRRQAEEDNEATLIPPPTHHHYNSHNNQRSSMNRYRSSISSFNGNGADDHLQVESSVSTGSNATINGNKRMSMGGGSRRPLSINRYHSNRNSFMGGEDDIDYMQDYENDQAEDWENILRQYDRYSYQDEDKRKSRRASRLLDPYQDSTVEVPIVDEPTYILDCYDFPPAFKTHHLHDIFRSYESSRGGYKIKWLSDTRALIIFDHPATAKKAYIDNVTHALAKIRPYDGPTDFLRDINNNSSNSNRASRPMSMDLKRQSFNYHSKSNRNSIKRK
ncbi:hypothetical protein BDF20DRAFT_885922 [Mycotypha africana]|uniref:uncharacterized protein n=1 Tax=Mycotypha africana TaxID=64632 RepID=UPI002300DDD3|nr:uncharacterized protein BDF20DRAFT_885922 [Mycotypha africana]KAI8971703.1 hypothetical protein BDF20DRAFT_885922 [Mycotypha africana]